jgi:hypothetical protein
VCADWAHLNPSRPEWPACIPSPQSSTADRGPWPPCRCNNAMEEDKASAAATTKFVVRVDPLPSPLHTGFSRWRPCGNGRRGGCRGERLEGERGGRPGAGAAAYLASCSELILGVMQTIHETTLHTSMASRCILFISEKSHWSQVAGTCNSINSVNLNRI